MKVKPEHVAYLRYKLEPYYTPERWEAYQDAGLNQTRFLWDAVYQAGLSMWLSDNLYPYGCNDDHLHTALSKIWRDIQKENV